MTVSSQGPFYFPPVLNVLYPVLLCVAFAVIEGLIGGTRLLFSLPAYLVLACAALLSLVDLRRVKAAPSGLCLWASAIFSGYILCRALVSPVAYIAWADEFMVLGALAVYLLTACYLTDPRRRIWVLAVLIVFGLANLLVGLRQFVRADNFMLFGFLRSARYTGRASGLYVCPDHLAFYLEVVGCLGLAAAVWGRSRPWIKLLFGYGALCLFGGELLTASRGGFFSAVAGLGVMTLLGLWRLCRTAPHLIGRVILALAVAVVLAAGGVRVVLARSTMLRGRASDLSLSQDIRPRLWKAGYAQFQTSPVFGTGAATYLYYGRRLRDPYVQDDPIRTHNDYLELLGEYGAVGGVGLLLFVAAHLWTSWKAFGHFRAHADGGHGLAGGPPGSNAAAWNIGALGATAAIGVHSMVDFNLHIPANTLLAAFVFGVLANPGRRLTSGGEHAPRPRPIDLLARLALGAVGLSIFVAGAPKLPGEYYCEKARVALRDHHTLAASGFALKGLEHEKRNPQLYFYLGEARLSLAGDGPDAPVAHSFRVGADEAFRGGLALAPWDTPLLLRHAEVLTIFGDLPAAQRVFATALEWDPNSALVQTYYGFYLQHAGRLPEARQAYTRAVQLAPNETALKGLDRVSKLGVGSN